MRGMAADQANIAKKKQRIMEEGFRLFAKRGIELVKMQEIADICHTQRGTVYRYFPTKLDLVVAISANVWGNFIQWNNDRVKAETLTAAQRYEFFVDGFLLLYREHRDMLRFNQFFNVFVANEQVSAEQMEPFTKVIGELESRFHDAYELAKQDGTLRTDIPENEIFSTTLHLMLAAVTRYAVGLIYKGGSDPEKELTALKEMLMRRYVTQKE